MFKKTLLTTVIILFLGTLYAQKTEYRAQLNSGFFSYFGNGSMKSSFIVNWDEQQHNTGYTYIPYGTKMTSSIGVSGNLTRRGKHNVLYGADLGFEILRSKTDIKAVLTSYTNNTASGETFLINHYINLYPFLGYRLINKKTKLDLTGGMDVAFCLQSKEKGSAIADGSNAGILFVTTANRKTINTDFRPRIQFAAFRKKIGAYAGYSMGIKNYRLKSFFNSNPAGSFSSYIRLGLSYQIH